jgi:hypothetical protein
MVQHMLVEQLIKVDNCIRLKIEEYKKFNFCYKKF